MITILFFIGFNSQLQSAAELAGSPQGKKVSIIHFYFLFSVKHTKLFFTKKEGIIIKN